MRNLGRQWQSTMLRTALSAVLCAGMLLVNESGAAIVHAQTSFSFAPPTNVAVGRSPYAVTVGDFNGHQDLVVANADSNNISVLLGNGDGTFQPAASYPVGSSPVSVAVGQLTSSSYQDIVVANSNGNSVSVLLGNGDGTFQPAVSYPAGTTPDAVAIGNFNGQQDIAVADYGGSGCSAMGVTVLLNNGSGVFTSTTQSPIAAGTRPTSIAVGNFNGQQDLAVADYGDSSCSPNTSGVSVLLGNGSGTFSLTSASPYATGSEPIYVAVGQFTSSGNKDLAVANYLSDDVSVLLGNGTGAFGSSTSYSTDVGPDSIAIANFGNGQQDMAVANYGGGGYTGGDVSVLLDNGSGAFTGPTNISSGAGPFVAGSYSIATAQFTSSGHYDLAVANNGNNDIGILFGNGNDTFRSAGDYYAASGPIAATGPYLTGPTQPLDFLVTNKHDLVSDFNVGPGSFQYCTYSNFSNAPNYHTAVVSADFNGDGYGDAAMTDFASNQISVALNTKNNSDTQCNLGTDGTFSSVTNYTVGYGPVGLAVGSFQFKEGSANTSQDLVVANQFSNSVSVLLNKNDGTGQFNGAANYSAGAGPIAVAVGDFNGDGYQDIAVANVRDNTVTILLNCGTTTTNGCSANPGTFYPSQTVTGLSAPDSLTVGNFGSGHDDIAVANGTGNSVSILSNDGSGVFSLTGSYAAGPAPLSIQSGKFGANGAEDLAVVNPTANTVSVLLGNGDDTFQAPVAYGTDRNPVALVAGYFGNGQIDLAAFNAVSDDVTVILGNGDGTFQSAPIYFLGAGLASVTSADFNGDGHNDIATANSMSNNVSVLPGKGDGTFEPATSYAVGLDPDSIATGSLRKTDKPDLVVANYRSNTVSVLLNNGNGTFQPAVNYSVGTGPSSVAVADVNGDGYPDIVVSNLASNTVSVLINNQDGTFKATMNYPVGHDPTAVAVGDLNADTHPDIVAANSVDGTVSVLLNIASNPGTFGSAQTYAAGSLPDSVAIGNFKGGADLAVGNAAYVNVSLGSVSSGVVTVLLNNGSGGFPSSSTKSYAVSSGPAAITAASFDNDAYQDIATANFGTADVSLLANCDSDTSNGCGGPGTFQAAQTFSAGSSYPCISGGSPVTCTDPAGIVATKLTSSGKPDIVTANYRSDDVSVMLNGTPTLARIAGLTARRHYGDAILRWCLLDRVGVAGFNIYDGRVRVNPKLIRVHRNSHYRYTARWRPGSAFTLHVVLTDGRQVVLHVS